LSAVCPICGYNQGEERILVAHLVGVHGGIPRVQGEAMFVCNNHPGIAPMSHLEFLKHAQEVTSTAMYGRAPPPKCQPVSVSQGQVVSMPLKEWQSIALGKAHSTEKNLKLRWGFSIASSGAVLLIINGARFIPLADWNYPSMGGSKCSPGSQFWQDLRCSTRISLDTCKVPPQFWSQRLCPGWQ